MFADSTLPKIPELRYFALTEELLVGVGVGHVKRLVKTATPCIDTMIAIALVPAAQLEWAQCGVAQEAPGHFCSCFRAGRLRRARGRLRPNARAGCRCAAAFPALPAAPARGCGSRCPAAAVAVHSEAPCMRRPQRLCPLTFDAAGRPTCTRG